jgi:hypothetical protein
MLVSLMSGERSREFQRWKLPAERTSPTGDMLVRGQRDLVFLAEDYYDL